MGDPVVDRRGRLPGTDLMEPTRQHIKALKHGALLQVQGVIGGFDKQDGSGYLHRQVGWRRNRALGDLAGRL